MRCGAWPAARRCGNPCARPARCPPSAGPTPTSPPLGELTDRESEVLRVLATGCTNAEIAGALGLVEGTVKNHVSSILMKLGVRDRVQAVLKAIEFGLID